MWPLLAIGAGMGLNIMGQQAASDISMAGVEGNIDIQQMQSEYMKELYEKDLERQQPFLDIGDAALAELKGTRVYGEADTGLQERMGGRRGLLKRKGPKSARTFTTGMPQRYTEEQVEEQEQPPEKETGLARMKRELTERSGLGEMSDYVKELTYGRMEAEEDELQYQRLMDLQQIGLGSAGTAGMGIQQLGRTLAAGHSQIGGMQSLAAQQLAGQKQDIWLQTADMLSGLPSYFASRSRPQYTTDYSIPMTSRDF